MEKDSIPPKKEYLIYAPLTEMQRELYDAIVEGGLRSYLMGGKKEKQPTAVEADDGPMKLRSARYKGGKTKQAAFDVLDGDDDEYFKLLESGQLDEKINRKRDEDLEELGRKHQLQAKSMLMPLSRYFANASASLSQENQQYEAAEHYHAAPKGLLPSVPFRLARGRAQRATCHQRRSRPR